MTGYIPAALSYDDLTLYRMYNSNDILVYVGITNRPRGRIGNHRDGKWWWPNIARITLERYRNREELKAAELAEIKLMEPRYNLANNPLYQFSAKDCRAEGHPGAGRKLCDECEREWSIAFYSLEEEEGEMALLQEVYTPGTVVVNTDNFYFPIGNATRARAS